MAADAKPWSLFEGLIQLNFESLEIAVVRPFDADARMVLATISATTKFLGIELYAELQYPGYYFSARQIGTTTVDLSYFQQQGIRLPHFLAFQFQIADIWITAQPGSPYSFYSFSMRLAPGTAWKIDDQYSLPDLRLAISGETLGADGPYLNWQFGARTNEGDKPVPVLLLARKLSVELGIELPKAPAAIEALTINRVELSYEARDEAFAIECRGQMPVNGVVLDGALTIAHQSSTPPETHFRGEVLLRAEGLEPLSFTFKIRFWGRL